MDTNVTNVCPEDVLILDCIVNGSVGDSTVWTGTALHDCDPSVILLHTLVKRAFVKECNKGAINITMKAENNTDSYDYSKNSLFRSQLVAVVQQDMIDNDIECIHDILNVTVAESTIGSIHLTSETAVCNASHDTTVHDSMVLVNKLKGINVIISSSIILLFILLFSTIIILSFLLYGFRKKLKLSNWSFPT